MISVGNILSVLPPYEGKNIIRVPDQTTDDIMYWLLRKHYRCAPQYDLIAEKFWCGNAPDTAALLFDFCKRNIKYKVEGLDLQTVRTPSAILTEGVGDCKHYASFIVGVLDALKRKGHDVHPCFMFVNGKPFENKVSHVFAAITTPKGDVWIDPVLNTFNEPYQYHYKIKKYPRTMALGDISGIEQDNHSVAGLEELSGIGSFKDILQNVSRAGKKAALAVPRNSFLLLMKLNAFNMAHRIHDGLEKNPVFHKKMMERWLALGGNWDVFKRNIRMGYDHYMKHRKGGGSSASSKALHTAMQRAAKGRGNRSIVHGMDAQIAGLSMDVFGSGLVAGIDYDGHIGEPITLATITASAGAIIAALSPLLKSLGIGVSKDGKPTDAPNAGNGSTPSGGGGNAPLGGGDSDIKSGGGVQKDIVPTGASNTQDVQASQREQAPSVTEGVFDKVTAWVGEHKAMVGVGVAVLVGVPLIKSLTGKKRR